MRPEDVTTLRTVQSILVRNYVDTQRLDVDVINGTVYIAGEFTVYDSALGSKKNDPVERDGIVKRTLLLLEREIRRMTGASFVQFKLANWERTGMMWTKKRKA
jgi:hypothetical protein